MSVLCLRAASAFAQEPTGELRVTLAEGCPSEAHFRERLRTLAAGRPVPSEGHVELVREAGGYRLRVETRDVSRTLHNPSCAKLVESAAVIVALGAAAAEQESAPTEAPAPPTLPQESARPAPGDTQAPTPDRPAPRPDVQAKPQKDARAAPPDAAPARHRQPYFAGWAELTALWGLVPDLTVRPALGMRVRGARVGAAISLDYALPQSSAGAEGVRVHGPGAGLLLSALLHARVQAALGPEVHLLWGRGQGVDHVRTAMLPLWAGRGELVVVPWLRGKTQLGIVLSAALPLERHAFVFKDGGTAYRPRPYQLMGGLRLTLERKRR